MELQTTGPGRTQLSDLKNLSGPIHFIGVGGIGMSALAKLLLAQGHAVSGSDKEENAVVRDLIERGLVFHQGHKADHVGAAAAIVVSTAITKENPEFAEAVSRSLPVWHRSQMLSYLSHESKLLAISGTHGKTTTTAMVAQILLDSGKDPSIVIGGIFSRIESNAQAGNGEFFVAEADESDGTHTSAKPFASLITNIEPDHLENYPGGMDEIKENMVRFAGNSSSFAVLCADDPACREIKDQIGCRVITYGSSPQQADYAFKSAGTQEMEVYKGSQLMGTIHLSVPGQHNKINALGAIAMTMELGVDFADAAKALSKFSGVDRRFQIIGQVNDITVVDDYAHHPTEVAATLQAARQYLNSGRHGAGRVVAVFQPHQPGRLRDLWDDFCNSFQQADLVLLADVYVARGKAIEGVTSERLAACLKHDNVHYLPGAAADLPTKILPYLNQGDLVLTIGAGDITRVGPQLLQLLKQEHIDGTDR